MPTVRFLHSGGDSGEGPVRRLAGCVGISHPSELAASSNSYGTEEREVSAYRRMRAETRTESRIWF
eukprot:476985-Prymnesium_polylepis.1